MAAGEDLRSVARVGAEAENNPGRKPEGGPGARLTRSPGPCRVLKVTQLLEQSP